MSWLVELKETGFFKKANLLSIINFIYLGLRKHHGSWESSQPTLVSCQHSASHRHGSDYRNEVNCKGQSLYRNGHNYYFVQANGNYILDI